MHIHVQDAEALVCDLKKSYWMAPKHPPTPKPGASGGTSGPPGTFKAPMMIEFCHHDNVSSLMCDKYKEKILTYRVNLTC